MSEPHPRLGILPTPNISSIYIVVPPPKSYNGQRIKFLASSISQPLVVPYVPSYIPRENEEKELMLSDTLPCTKSLSCNRQNFSMREHR